MLGFIIDCCVSILYAGYWFFPVSKWRCNKSCIASYVVYTVARGLISFKWHHCISRLTGATDTDDTEDSEYNFMADDQNEEQEEYRTDRAVTISRKMCLFSVREQPKLTEWMFWKFDWSVQTVSNIKVEPKARACMSPRLYVCRHNREAYCMYVACET
jgi:hypothetical protein